MAQDVRAAAARVLGQVLAGKSLNYVLPPALDTVAAEERGLLQQLVYGGARNAPKYQAILQQLIAKPLRAKDNDIQALLIIGLYQLDALRIPDHAAVDTTVRATRSLRKQWAKGMVNAVMRRFLREGEALMASLDAAAAANHPQWWFDHIHQQWPEHASRIIEANNQQPPLTLRCNALRTQRDDYLSQLQAAGIEARPGQHSPQAVTLTTPIDVAALPGFKDGLVSVQDETAQLAALALDPQPGDRVLDACAAPGGKACHLLEQEPTIERLTAGDKDEQRLNRVRDNFNRLQLDGQTLALDATTPDDTLKPNQTFNKILVDAPCSASGVLRRNPDVKLIRRDIDLQRFAEQQIRILEGLWPRLENGGDLLYITCSIFAEENDRVIARFIEACSNAEVLPLSIPGSSVCDTEPRTYGRQVLPDPDGGDGMFFCRLQKRV